LTAYFIYFIEIFCHCYMAIFWRIPKNLRANFVRFFYPFLKFSADFHFLHLASWIKARCENQFPIQLLAIFGLIFINSCMFIVRQLQNSRQKSKAIFTKFLFTTYVSHLGQMWLKWKIPIHKCTVHERKIGFGY